MRPVTTFLLGACTAVLCLSAQASIAQASAWECHRNGANDHRTGVVSSHAGLGMKTVYGPGEKRYLQFTNNGRKPLAVLVKTSQGSLVHRVYLGTRSRQRLTLGEREQEHYQFEVVSGRLNIKRLTRQVAKTARDPLRLPETIPGEAISVINAAETVPIDKYAP